MSEHTPEPAVEETSRAETGRGSDGAQDGPAEPTDPASERESPKSEDKVTASAVVVR